MLGARPTVARINVLSADELWLFVTGVTGVK